jgi:uridine kinase
MKILIVGEKGSGKKEFVKKLINIFKLDKESVDVYYVGEDIKSISKHMIVVRNDFENVFWNGFIDSEPLIFVPTNNKSNTNFKICGK